ncbi:hypothetical protein NDU88_012182 [Pleurodeles waltl]|uniref:Uncharacterized protein n=1 Tax=Pleurodeles waltl TaxID=8319 RepID=A0AAV7R188_PLEWA|nr:hypothetical protein NDU88_012182 [Pleurodeles waltl]
MFMTDPHLLCLWCLECDHDLKPCSEHWAMNLNALREQSLKLMVVRHSALPSVLPLTCTTPSVSLGGAIPIVIADSDSDPDGHRMTPSLVPAGAFPPVLDPEPSY